VPTSLSSPSGVTLESLWSAYVVWDEFDLQGLEKIEGTCDLGPKVGIVLTLIVVCLRADIGM